jgi:hypothetical protein
MWRTLLAALAEILLDAAAIATGIVIGGLILWGIAKGMGA